MARRIVLLAALFSLMIGSTSFAVDPPSVNAGGVTGLDLQTQLEKGLKARHPVEFAYIAQIIALVEAGELPESLVTSTFIWAASQAEPAIAVLPVRVQARATGLNVTLPDLRQQSVGLVGQQAIGSQ